MFRAGILQILLIVIFITSVMAQEVEHNFPVGPANTNCDSLHLAGLSFDAMMQKIENTSFRFHQNFRNRRLSGIRAGRFFSCDGKKGILHLTIDGKNILFQDIPKQTWEDLLTSSDPDRFYEEKVKDIYPVLAEN